MRLDKLAAAVAAALFLASCDIEVDNSAPPGSPPASTSGADTAGGATAGGGSGTGTPGAPADPGAGATPPPAGGTTPPPAGGTPPPAAAATHIVKLLNMQYNDAANGSTTTTIKVGDSVVWQNVDSMDHTTTSDTGVWDAPVAQGASFKFTFTKAGSYPYTCLKHKSTMKGTIVVQ